MSRWICPACEREFGRENQAHVCVPGCTVDECFAGRPAAQREIYDALMSHLDTLGLVHADAVTVGVFLKSDRKLGEVRPMARALSLELALPRTINDARVARTIRTSGDRVVHFIRMTSVTEVDDQIREWLTEAYVAATD